MYHGPKLAAAWFDKHLPWRSTCPELVDDVLLIHPSREYIRALPGSELPDRADFQRFCRAPEERIRRWSEALGRSDALAAQLFDDLRTSRLVERVEPMAR